jgi:cytochrome c556
MRITVKALGRAALVCGFITLAACGGGGPSYDEESPEGAAYELRHSVMHIAGLKMEFINNMARETIAIDEAAFVRATNQLAVLTEMMPEGFESELTVAESRSLPEIWDNKADFDMRMQAAIDATADLADAARNGGFAAAQSVVVGSPALSSTYCGGCHNTYRAREE